MQDIFISPISVPMRNWSEAFPDALFVQGVAEISFAQHPNATIWLHKNQVEAATALILEDQPNQWLTDAVQAVRKAAQAANIQAVRMIVLANAPHQTEAIHCLRVGAMGYSHAYTDSKVLQEIKTVVENGGVWIGQDALRQLIESSSKRVGSQAEYVEGLLNKLTTREREVALQTAKGDSNKEIARTLQITERTVKAHLAHIFERLGAKDRLQLALMLNKKTD